MSSNKLRLPYYAVIFTSKHSSNIKGYSKMADAMEKLAKIQPGYLGFESVRNSIGITISYWEDIESIKLWKANSEHILAQNQGKSKWYDWYKVEICRVEHSYEFFFG